MEQKADLIVSRVYQKGDQFQSLFVREVTGGDIDGSVFQIETCHNNVEDKSAREQSGDIYHIRNRYNAKLQNLMDDGWKKINAGVYANRNSIHFNPDVL
ncbi:MAG: hypothetical protein V4555_14935 [Acidobacteriota bacterium]